MKTKQLNRQVVVITGASSGIGLAIAERAARAGARVMLAARSAAVLEEAAERMNAAGGEAAWCVADVGELEQVQAVAAAALTRFGAIDTWINNAGVAIYSDLLTTPRDEHEQLFRTDYWGAVNGAEVAVEAMREAGGTLITVGSIASDMGAPVMGAYVAAKHAVKGYMDSLRIELLRDRVPVRVTLVKPSGVGTPLDAHVSNHRPGRPRIPPPAYSPERVAATVLRAATHPIREITVGGAGVAQVMAATHFPWLFARLAGGVTVLLNDVRRRSHARSNLFEPSNDPAVRGQSLSKPFSAYTTLRERPFLALVTASTLLGLLAVYRRRRGIRRLACSS